MENTLLIVIDPPKHNKYFLKLYENYVWYRNYWNERHNNMKDMIDYVKKQGGKIMWANYVNTEPKDLHKCLVNFQYDLTHNDQIPKNIKRIYLVGESLDICIMHRPMGYTQLSKDYDVSVVIDACIVGEKVCPNDWVIKGKKCNIVRRQICDPRYAQFIKYHEMFCNTNKVKYIRVNDIISVL